MLGFEDHLKKMNLRCPLQRCTATFLNSNMLKRHILNLHISYLVQFVKDRGIQAIKVNFYSFQRLITKICDWSKYDNRLQCKKYMSDQTVLLLK